MQSSINLEEEGWKRLTWLWVIMFVLMALANEIAWRNLTTDQWVSFKAFGIPVLSVFFGLLSLPILKKYRHFQLSFVKNSKKNFHHYQ